VLRSVKIIAKPSFVERELFVKFVPMKGMSTGERLQALSRVSVGVENSDHAASFMLFSVDGKIPGLLKIPSLVRMYYPISRLNLKSIVTMFLPNKIT
jgi:hypothetical protein